MGKQWKQCQTLFLGGSKITADGDCSHEIKRHLLLGRKVMTNLDSIFKSRDITLSTKVCLVKAMIFPVVMYRCESWTVKKAECQRIDVFELWCWRRLLRVPWTARRSNQSILKVISPGCSLQGLMLKLKLQILWLPDAKSWLIGKDPDAGRDWGQEEKGMTEDEMAGWHHRLDGHEFGWTTGVGDGQGGLARYNSWVRKELDTTERLNWIELMMYIKLLFNQLTNIYWTSTPVVPTLLHITISRHFETHWQLNWPGAVPSTLSNAPREFQWVARVRNGLCTLRIRMVWRTTALGRGGGLRGEHQ